MTNISKVIQESEKKLFVGLAGPGTGKSTKFKEIVQSEEFKGKKILILSFINKLVDDLVNDFKEFDNVKVSTLHSFARQRLGDVDLDENLDDLISQDYFFINKKEIKYQEKFYDNLLTNDEEIFYRERADYYKKEKKLYSFNSIVYASNRLFGEHEDKIPSCYDLILVDEFQDFNKAEYELIKFLNKKSKVVLVGDDNQSLYYFKKAKPELIQALYNDSGTDKFSLDYCYRCTKVVVDTVNNLLKNAKSEGYLKDRLDKKFLYPEDNEKKKELSNKYDKIDFISSVPGHLLIYELEKSINSHVNINDKKRILILAPGYLKSTIYEGLLGKGFNVVEFELFSNEECNNIKHKNIVDAFETLVERKTDNLALRKMLPIYLNDNRIRSVITKSKSESKKIWSIISRKVQKLIENDINIFKKVKKSSDGLTPKDLKRFNEIFTLKNILSKIVKGFKPVKRKALEIEMTTVMSSKGLSADFVYYVGVDDRNTLDRMTGKFTDHNICEFLVGITRAKEKLTLVSLFDSNPKILDLIDAKYINRINRSI